jgi:hypothetical protein
MTSGPGPTNSQKTGWSLYAETIVPRSTSEKANPKPLMSPVVQFSLIVLFTESPMRVSALYYLLALGILRGLSEFCGKEGVLLPADAHSSGTGRVSF